VRRTAILGVVFTALTSCACASEPVDFFERKIRPVLIRHCYECHAGDSDLIQGGLRLDHPDAMARGGDSGAAVMPGEPDKSLLLTAIRYDELEMPPSGPLDESIVRDFERWIETGAVDPRESDPLLPLSQARETDWETAKQFWSFQQPQRHAAPCVSSGDWVGTKVDSFVLAQMEQVGLSPNPPASRATLIRRLSFDLTGLPPSPAEVEAFVNDTRPSATRRLVDRLLASPTHGERWARMWLDVVRFAEDQAHQVGKNTSLTYPNAYLYRDWVVDAFAADMPYDQFVRMQLAADVIDPKATDSHVALGFLGLGPKYYRRNDPQVMADEWEDRIDTVSRGLLGLTVACARCHDHKFDPIPTTDYYALAGVFAGTEMYNRLIDAGETGQKGDAKNPIDAVHIVREGKPVDLNVMIRGDVNKLGPVAQRRFLTVLSSGFPQRFKRGSGRIDLADAITDRSNPLTARVIVNRVWGQMMGTPLVRTASNFGQLGDTPTHPRLLDDLAVRLMDNDWSLKWLQREIALSSTYAQSSAFDLGKHAIDPENQRLWRMHRKRLSIESFRDAVLSAAGRIDLSRGGRSMKPDDPRSRRRTLYSSVSRLKLNPMLARFDFPDPNAHSAGRYETTTPLQKLYLLNSPFWIEQSEAFASRMIRFSQSTDQRVTSAYQILFARDPSAQETKLARSYFAQGNELTDAEKWSQYLQTLLISNEMFIVD
tara:strand:+ start:204815 stop:206947 length:2133 start_codon:yes stop_codon:yes gene_type:complete